MDILHDFYIPILKCAVRYDRIAGYFRSSSLAAASQGFSAFTDAGGKMRLVVGADLNEDDVIAILQGDQQRLANGLNAAFADAESWPEEVTRGVQLLAWMVSKGHLEVQVAFRVHGKTGKPLAFDAMIDGYVHEKWAVFTDKESYSIYISGSLNESKTALALNAENIDVHADWWNDLERQRTETAQQDFNRVWADKSPYLRVMPLPEAVKQKLISYADGIELPSEIDGTAAKPEREPPSALERLQFALIKDGPKLPGGRFVGMETAPVTPWPHQEVVARRLIETWPYSYLLCDEVGLGKTIEAGLAIRSLVLSGLVKRVLIAPPASLTKQWQREMATKFLLSFGRALSGGSTRHDYIFPAIKSVDAKTLYTPDLCIVSTGLFAHTLRQPDLLAARPFDIALVDEAHYARRKNPAVTNNRRVEPRFGRLYTTIRDELRQRSEALWLATATPMQLDWIEVYDLIHLSNRVGAFQDDPTLTWGYYDLLSKLVRGEDISTDEWEFLRQVICSIAFHDPFLQQYFAKAVIDGRIRVAEKQWRENGRIPRGRDRENIRRLIFSAAPLSRVMLRHTRPLLEIYKKEKQLKARLAKRTILPIQRIKFTSHEQEAYDELEAFCDGLAEQIQHHSDDQFSQNNLKFFLSLLRLRFASSLFAIRETIRRRRERVITSLEYQNNVKDPDLDDVVMEFGDDEDDHDSKVLDALLKNRSKKDLQWEKKYLTGLIEILQGLSERPSKIQALLDALQNQQLPGGRFTQTVIFTRFYDTLTDIVGKLRAINPSMLIGTYSGRGGQYVDPATGKLCSVDREEIKQRFLREEIDILVCTDAAAEGLNLQTANLLINFDLPWNPMKVEQRIGRIDRIGQKYEEIFVLNLCYVGSVEEIVYGKLLQRLAQAGNVVGTQQVSMLPVSEADFQKLAMGELSEDELLQQAEKRITHQQERTASMEIPASELYEIYMRLSREHAKTKSPVTLDAIWDVFCNSAYLRQQGCTVSQDGRIMTVCGIPDAPEKSLLTIDRDLFEKGLPGEERPFYFASYGDPVFDAIIAEIDQYELPQCVYRLSAKTTTKNHAEMVSYAVATTGGNDKKEMLLLSSLESAAGLPLDTKTKIDESMATGEKQRLRNRANKDFLLVEAIANVEGDNKDAARSQHLLNLVNIFTLLADLDVPNQDNFRTTINRLDVSLQENGSKRIRNDWADALRPYKNKFLFNVNIPEIGNKATVQAPSLLVQSAVDTGYRVALSMRRNMADLTVGEVRDRLEREIKRHTQRG